VLIAVCNTLLKQAFTVVKSGLKYDSNYIRKTYDTLIKIYLFFLQSFVIPSYYVQESVSHLLRNQD